MFGSRSVAYQTAPAGSWSRGRSCFTPALNLSCKRIVFPIRRTSPASAWRSPRGRLRRRLRRRSPPGRPCSCRRLPKCRLRTGLRWRRTHWSRDRPPRWMLSPWSSAPVLIVVTARPAAPLGGQHSRRLLVAAQTDQAALDPSQLLVVALPVPCPLRRTAVIVVVGRLGQRVQLDRLVELRSHPTQARARSVIRRDTH